MFQRVIGGESVQFEVEGRRKDGTRLLVEMRAGADPLRRPAARARHGPRYHRAQGAGIAPCARRSAWRRSATSPGAWRTTSTTCSPPSWAHRARRAREARPARSSCATSMSLASPPGARPDPADAHLQRGRRGPARSPLHADAVAESLKLLRARCLRASSSRPISRRARWSCSTRAARPDLLNLTINARDAMAGIGRIEVAVHTTNCRESRLRELPQALPRRLRRARSPTRAPASRPQGSRAHVRAFLHYKDVGRGSGMGLATVHGIVHEHDGHVIVASAPAGRFASCFRFHGGDRAGGAGSSPRGARPSCTGACWWSTTRRPWPISCASCSKSWVSKPPPRPIRLGVLEHGARALRLRDPRPDDARHLRGQPRARDRRRPPGAAGRPLHRQQRPSRPPELSAAGVRALLRSRWSRRRLYETLSAHLH